MEEIRDSDGWENINDEEELQVFKKKDDDGIMMLKKRAIINKPLEDVFKYYSC